MAEEDGFFDQQAGLDAPARHARAVTASDSTTFDPPVRGLYVGGAGNITVQMADGTDDVVFSNVPEGVILPVRVIKVKAATTATNIVRLW